MPRVAQLFNLRNEIQFIDDYLRVSYLRLFNNAPSCFNLGEDSPGISVLNMYNIKKVRLGRKKLLDRNCKEFFYETCTSEIFSG